MSAPERPLLVSAPERPLLADPPHFVRAGGFRHVVPYLYTWRATAKGRWAGTPLLQLLAREFPRFSRGYFEAALRSGAVRLGGAQTEAGALVRAGDVLEHDAHRHEPPVRDVSDAELELREHDFAAEEAETEAGASAGAPTSARDRIVSVCKPASWPVHATGGYLKNTLQYVLEVEHGMRSISGGDGIVDGCGGDSGGGGGGGGGGNGGSGSGGSSGLRMLYRIDRMASGLVLFASSQRACAAFLARLQSGGVRKLYLARVAGRLEARLLKGAERFRDDPDVTAGPTPLASWAAFRREVLCLQRDDCGASGEPQLAAGVGTGAGAGSSPAGVETSAAPECPTSIVLLQPHLLSVRHPVCPAPGRTKRGRFFSGAAARAARSDASSAEGRRGKESATDIVPVAYDAASDTTLVLALPRTGRTHQIRVHLQGLGHAIVDDPAYGGRGDFLRDERGAVPRGHAPEAAEALREALAAQRRAASGPAIEVLSSCPACSGIAGATTSTTASTSDGESDGSGGGGAGAGVGVGASEGAGGEGGGLPFRGAISLHALCYILDAAEQRSAGGSGVQPHVFRVALPSWWRPAPDPLVSQ